MNGGRRLRLDGLVVVLVTHIVPFILLRRQLEREYAAFRKQRHERFTGAPPAPQPQQTPLAYLHPDGGKDERAQELFQAGKVLSVEWCEGALTAKVACGNLCQYGSSYVCRLLPWVNIVCTCPNFAQYGGYCKHLRAALLKVPRLPK